MIVAMVAVGRMQVTVHQIIDVITVRHRLMAASRPVHVVGAMAGTPMIRSAAIGVLLRNLDDVFIDVVTMRMLQMTIFKIVDVVAMPNRGVPAIGTMRMGLRGWCCHDGLLLRKSQRAPECESASACHLAHEMRRAGPLHDNI